MIHLLGAYHHLYIKTQNYHWNVEGPSFITLHELFEEQYVDVAETIDALAELIRQFNHKVPFIKVQDFETYGMEIPDPGSSPKHMVEDLKTDHTAIETMIQERMSVKDYYDHPVIEDFFMERLKVHRKTIWILESILK
jgi:starvation-inducible DNA-binding protein